MSTRPRPSRRSYRPWAWSRIAGSAAMAVTLAVGTLTSSPVAAFAPSAKFERVAVVDVQRVLLETREGKRELEKVQKSFAQADAKLEEKAKRVEKQFRDLQSKAAMLNEAELRRRQEEILRAQQELERLALELQDDVMKQEAVATERVYGKVAALVKQFALEENLQVVLVKSEATVLFVNPKLDLTNRVIVRYDQQHK